MLSEKSLSLPNITGDMGEYDDIINLPHHVSKNHPQMSMWKRAAQFAPFAALSGYSEAVKDAERENEELYEPQIDDSDMQFE